MQYGSALKFSFAYNETATTNTDQGALYVQYNSANNNGFISTRSETFDNFKINKRPLDQCAHPSSRNT